MMKNAKALLLEVLAVIPDSRKVVPLFADDGVMELPFLSSLGIESRYQGHAKITGFFDLVVQPYPDFTFKPQDIKVLIETPDQVFAEYTAHTKAAGTGRLIHHLFAGRLVAENGQIKLLRESLNVIAAAQALYPNGVAELPRPEAEIFSAPPGYHS
jgi:uncharacterized protein